MMIDGPPFDGSGVAFIKLAAKPTGPRLCLLIKNAALDQPANRTFKVGAIEQDLIRIAQIHNGTRRPATHTFRPKLDKGIRLQAALGAAVAARTAVRKTGEAPGAETARY